MNDVFLFRGLFVSGKTLKCVEEPEAAHFRYATTELAIRMREICAGNIMPNDRAVAYPHTGVFTNMKAFWMRLHEFSAKPANVG